MKNKENGFTLVELLAVLVIMGVLIALAVPSYITVSNNAKKRTYDNKITTIALAAEKYANDNNIVGSASISVMDLIKAGYYQADSISQDGNTYKVDNPIDNSSMLCYIANIITEDGTYKANVIPGSADASSNCVASSINKDITITAYQYDYNTKTKGVQLSDGTKTELDWTNQDVVLIASLSDPSLIASEYTFSLGGNSQKKSGTESNSNQYIVHASFYLDATVYASVKLNNGETRSNNIRVKIDKEKPTLTITSNGQWSQDSKPVTLNGSDGSGSGVKAYFITQDANKVPVVSDFTLNPNNNTMYQTSLNTGIYYMYVMDKANNISTKNVYVINKQDANGPVCLYSGENTTWRTTPVTITFSCKDTGAGCKDNQTTSRTYNSIGTEVSTFNWNDVFMEDNLGNKTVCNQALNIYYDTKGPDCHVDSNGTHKNSLSSYFTSDITISIVYSDNGSGVGGSLSTKGVSTTNSTIYTPAINYQNTDTKGTTWYGFAKDNLGNATSCTPATVYRDTVAPTIKFGLSGSTASYSCADDTSGVVSAGSTFDMNGQATPYIYNVSCTDNAGNISYNNHTYNFYRASDCGIESYNSCATASCGVDTYESCPNATCTCKEYNKKCTKGDCIGYSSTPSGHENTLTPDCNGTCYANNTEKEICSTATFGGSGSTCYFYPCNSWKESCVNTTCKTRNSCPNEACGVKNYKTCEAEACGVASYKFCWHS